MMSQDELENMHNVIRSLGPVWHTRLVGEEPITLSPGGPYRTDEEILFAERKLGIRIPDEFRCFMRYYGSPYFMGHKIMTIYPADFADGGSLPASDDIVAHYELNIRHGILRAGELAFLETDENGIFFYKCVPMNEPGESSSAVYRIFSDEDEREIFAPSMTALLARWVIESSS